MVRSHEDIVRFEHLFWLQILGDHARFIYGSLAKNEGELLEQAKYYIDTFDVLLNATRKTYQNGKLHDISEAAYKEAGQIRRFKLLIIEKHLKKDVTIGLSPTFMNHMVNEVEEYLRILPYFIKQEAPPAKHPLHHHLIWLLDARGHAGAIDCSLDQVEHQLKEKSKLFTNTFEKFYLKAVEMAGYLRANISKFPALSRFHSQVELEMKIFQQFLKELEDMEMDEEILSTFSPLMADHMFREECYYLTKLAESTQIDPPNCDPTSPRNTKK